MIINAYLKKQIDSNNDQIQRDLKLVTNDEPQVYGKAQCKPKVNQWEEMINIMKTNEMDNKITMSNIIQRLCPVNKYTIKTAREPDLH